MHDQALCRALKIHKQLPVPPERITMVRSPLEQARALEGAARCARAAGPAAAAGLRAALRIYERIGAFEAAKLAAELADQ